MTVRMTLLRVEGNVKLQKQRVSRWRREKVQMNHELYLVKVVNSNKSVSRWQNISPSTAQTVISKCRHQYAAQQAVSSVVWSCSCRELLDVACIRANDSCWTLILYSKPKAQGISQPKIWWRKKERGGNQCVQWRCKAHVRCPCFPGNFLKPYSQPVTEKWMGKAGHGLSFPAWKKKCYPFPAIYRVWHDRCGEESFSVSGRTELCFLMRFCPWRRLFMVASQTVLLIYKPSCDVQAWKKYCVLPWARYEVFLFFLCLGFKRRDTQEGEGTSRQLETPSERVGLLTTERGIVPLVWNYLNGRLSNKAKPLPHLKPS